MSTDPVAARPRPGQRASVLFVCNANVCRSPLAQALFTGGVGGVAGETWSVASAGVRATAGLPMIDECAGALSGSGFPAGAFRSRAVTADLVRAADAVITMTRAELHEVLRVAPAALHRTVTLLELRRSAARGAATGVPGSTGPDRFRELVARAVRDRGPTRPPDPAEDDIPDPAGGSRGLLTEVTDRIAVAVREVVGAVQPGVALSRR